MDTSASAMPHAQDVRAAFIAMHHDVEIGQVLDLAIERMPLDDPDALRGVATACVAIMDTSASALPHAQDVRAAFIAMHHDVEIGQVLDLAIERMPRDDPDALRGASAEVFRWKTASYTTIAPLHLAFLSAGMNRMRCAAPRPRSSAGRPPATPPSRRCTWHSCPPA